MRLKVIHAAPRPRDPVENLPPDSHGLTVQFDRPAPNYSATILFLIGCVTFRLQTARGPYSHPDRRDTFAAAYSEKRIPYPPAEVARMLMNEPYVELLSMTHVN